MGQQTVFLSHAGADAQAARMLKRRLLASPEAQAAGLRVWLDLDDLEEGRPWQDQIAEAIADASIFAVLIGAGGAQNWVKAETDLALSRAVKEDGFRLIPVLMDGAGSKDISPFARRYHGVRDPLNNDEALTKLLQAALAQGPNTGLPILTDRPFIGLRAMDETWSDRFFGRDREVTTLIKLLRQRAAAAILAESGAGKSSLALAGLAPAWRGGALRENRPREGAPEFWHVIAMRPRNDPLQGLKDAVTVAAQILGRDEGAQAGYRKRLSFDDPSESLYALECGLPPDHTRTLLIIDQAEELITQSGGARDPRVQDFGRLLQELARLGEANERLRIVFTARREHFSALSAIDGFSALLQTDLETPHLQLGLPGAAEIDALVRRPLAMAGRRDEAEQDQLIQLIQNDLADRPGDLALVQMTLSVIWRNRKNHGGLIGAYAAAGGVLKALGGEAERLENSLRSEQRALLLPIFARLVRLGEAVGATRRSEPLENFSREKRALIDRLAGEDGGRLLQLSEATVEIAHEALIFQWPALSRWVFDPATAEDMRLLDRLMERAQGDVPAIGQDLERFQALARRHDDWLSETERAFLKRSVRRVWRVRWGNRAAVVMILSFAAGMGMFAVREQSAALEAEQARDRAETALNQAAATANRVVFEIAQRFEESGLSSALIANILEEAEQLHDVLAAQSPAARDTGLQRGRAVALAKLGDAYARIESAERASPKYQEALRIFRALADIDPNNAGWRRDVSVSLNKLGDFYRLQGQREQALQAYEESLQIRRALAEIDPDNAGWRRDVSVSLTNLGDLYRLQGQREQALQAYEESLQIRRALADIDPDNAGWRRDVSVSLERLGDLYRLQGQREQALQAYEESLQIRRALAEIDPDNAGWRRDVSVSLNKLGDLYRLQGQREQALQAYEESLQIARALADIDPDNAGWRRDVSVSLNKLGDLYRLQGQREQALQAYEESLQIFRALAQIDPDNAGWRRDVSVSLTNLGDLYRLQGQREQALQAYEESLQIARVLADIDPDNAGWRRDVSVSLERLGDLYRLQGQREQALQAYEESLQIARALAQIDPDNAGWRRDVSVSLTNLGDLYRLQGQREQALQAYEESLQIARALAQIDPDNAGWRRDVSVSLTNLGDLYRLQGQREQALQAYEESLQIARALAEIDPDNAGWRRDVSVSLTNLGDLYRLQGQREQALQAYEESLQIARALADIDPDNVGWRTDIVVSLVKLSQVATTPEACRLALDEAIAITEPLAAAGVLSAQQQNWPAALRGAHAACAQLAPAAQEGEP